MPYQYLLVEIFSLMTRVVLSPVVKPIGDEKQPQSDCKHNVINVRNFSLKSPFIEGGLLSPWEKSSPPPFKKGGKLLRTLMTLILNNEVPFKLYYESGRGFRLLLPIISFLQSSAL
jgi:hypothetical protein